MSPIRSHSFAPAFAALAFVLAPVAGAQPEAPPGFDAYVEAVREAFDVPGLSVAIVKSGETVLARGYGVRALGERAPVDEHTLFGIASNTKAFTATALAMLVEEGRLSWDDPVVRHLPAFALSDPYVTNELTVRDLLVHRSGLSLGAGDLLWWPPTDLSRDEIVRRLRHLPLTTSFRSQYAYDNVLYLVAGEVVEAVSGEPWEDFVQERILDRLGMDDSRALMSEGAEQRNVAGTHAPVEGRVQAVAPFVEDNVGPAASIYSSARDMARWLTVQLDSGRVERDERLFSRATAEQLWAPVTPLPIPAGPPELAALRPQFRGYALGFNVRDYRGYKVVSHTGGLPGYLSELTLIPGIGLGVVVLTNQESGAAFRAITQRVMDHYLGAPDTDWLAAYEAVTAQGAARVAAADAATAAARDSTSGPSLSLGAYAGRYTDPWYGDVTITEEGGGLAIRFAHSRDLVGDLRHWQHDTFVARWRDRTLRADAFVSFALNPDGSIREARMRAVSPSTDFSFDFQDLVLRPAPEE